MNEPSHRRRVVRFLALLSSEEALSLLARWTEPERAAYELCRAWFEKIYIPSGTYLDGLRGDRSSAAVERFHAEFDEDEISALERFHRFVELRMAMLSDESLEAGRIPLTDSWSALVKHAGYLLDELGVDAAAAQLHHVERLQDFEGQSGGISFILHEGSPPDRSRPPQDPPP